MYIVSKNIIQEAINKKMVLKIFTSDIKYAKTLDFCNQKIPIKKISKNDVNKYIGANCPNNYFAEIKNIEMYNFEYLLSFINDAKTIIVLDHVFDPQNFGAIIRTCVAMGFFYILVPKNRQCKITPAVIKASAGAIFDAKIVQINSLLAAIQKLKNNYNYWVYSTCIDKNTKYIKDIVFNNPKIIIFGNEHSGISKSILNISDEKFKLKINNLINSYNLSVSVGITLYILTNKN